MMFDSPLQVSLAFCIRLKQFGGFLYEPLIPGDDPETAAVLHIRIAKIESNEVEHLCWFSLKWRQRALR